MTHADRSLGALPLVAGFARVCPLRRTSHRAALGAPRGLSPESGGVDSALVRVAFVDTDLLPSPLSLATVALLTLMFLRFSFVCVLERVAEACSNWR